MLSLHHAACYISIIKRPAEGSLAWDGTKANKKDRYIKMTNAKDESIQTNRHREREM